MNPSGPVSTPEVDHHNLRHLEVASHSILSELEVRTDYLLRNTRLGEQYGGYLAFIDPSSGSLAFREYHGKTEFNEIRVTQEETARVINVKSIHARPEGGRKIVEAQVAIHNDGRVTYDHMIQRGFSGLTEIRAFQQAYIPKHEAHQILDQLTRMTEVSADPAPSRQSTLSRIGSLLLKRKNR